MNCQTTRPMGARRRAPRPARDDLSPRWRMRAAAVVLLLTSACLAACGEPTSVGAAPDERVLTASEPDEHDAAAHDGGEHDDGEHGGADVVHLSTEQISAAGIALATAERATLGEALSLPAEVRFDPDRIANVAPPVGGVVRSLAATAGDLVDAGETLAVLSSRELADLKAEFLTAQSAEGLARIELARTDELTARNVAPEARLQTVRAELASAVAAREAAETKLHALGLGHDVLDRLLDAEDGSLSLFPLTAPIAGQVVRRAATLGQSIEDGGAREPMFVIADASVLWVDVTVFKNDLARVRVGTPATLVDETGAAFASGELSFISPVIEETSRTATARIVVDNADGRLRPGQFVTARLDLGDGASVVRAPEAAVQTVEGRDAVFVPVEDGFAPRTVVVGRRARGFIEIVAGLEPGERYVSSGAFTLKAELEEAAFGDGHAH